jgi:hypothetical protein
VSQPRFEAGTFRILVKYVTAQVSLVSWETVIGWNWLRIMPSSRNQISIFLGLYSTCGPWPLFQFLNLYTVGRTPWTGDQPVARPLPTHRINADRVPRVGFEPTIPVFERAKTLRPHGHCDWQEPNLSISITLSKGPN